LLATDHSLLFFGEEGYPLVNQVLPKIERSASSLNYGKFVISPLESGYGITLGNALRRVLLSSLPGAAVTSLRVTGVHHEFSAIPHVREDTTALLLNIKQIRFLSDTDETVRVHVEVRGEGPITAGDLVCPPEIEVINPELQLLTADSDQVDIDLEMVVQKGKGYSPAEEREKLPLGEIPVDAIFSPIRKVNYVVQRARVGQQTDFDRLILEIWTDGTITPHEALSQSAKELVQLFSLIAGVEAAMAEAEAIPEEGIPASINDAPIEDLDLSARAFNCLKRAGITRVGEILRKLEQGGEDEILAIRNFGRKSLDELLDRLDTKGYLDLIGFHRSALPDVTAGDGQDIETEQAEEVAEEPVENHESEEA
jgi:DNA-directed RNA polymerase subunit alpha